MIDELTGQTNLFSEKDFEEDQKDKMISQKENCLLIIYPLSLIHILFGQMKADMHYKRFRHFGMDKVYMDLGLFGMGFNLKKYLGIKR